MLSLQSFLREGRVVGLCWAQLKPKRHKEPVPVSAYLGSLKNLTDLKHGLSKKQFPVSAYLGNLNNLKDPKEEVRECSPCFLQPLSPCPLGKRVPLPCISWSLVGGPPGEAVISAGTWSRTRLLRAVASTVFGVQGFLAIKNTHRPYGGPMLLGIELPGGPRAVRVLNFE